MTAMCSFVHRDLIAEKLEIASTLGLVRKYAIRPAEPAGAVLSVRVWLYAGANEDAVSAYLTRLLDGLVPGEAIMVADVPALPEGPRVARISAAA